MHEVLEKCNLFFVYGTLKTGRHNNTYLSTSEFIGEAQTKDNYYLQGQGIPYLLVGDGRSVFPVKGEVFRVTDPDVAYSVDALEGEGRFYHRKLIDVIVNGETTKAWAYLINSEKYPYPHLNNDAQEWH